MAAPIAAAAIATVVRFLAKHGVKKATQKYGKSTVMRAQRKAKHSNKEDGMKRYRGDEQYFAKNPGSGKPNKSGWFNDF